MRFSRKAARPSLKSFVRQDNSEVEQLLVHGLIQGGMLTVLMACLASPIATVGPEASRVSSSSATSSSSAGSRSGE